MLMMVFMPTAVMLFMLAVFMPAAVMLFMLVVFMSFVLMVIMFFFLYHNGIPFCYILFKNLKLYPQRICCVMKS